MTWNEMSDIMKYGKLVMSETCYDFGNWQYWQYKDWWYSINTDGNPDRVSIWCNIKELPGHLRHLERICGYKFEKQPRMIVIHPELIPQY